MLWSYQMRSRAIVKFTPPNLSTTRRISDQDIAGWFSSPDRLVEKCFISTEMVCRIFYVDDYSVKKRKGPQYDVLYEDLGFDEVQTLDRATLLGMLTDELVTNTLPRSCYHCLPSLFVMFFHPLVFLHMSLIPMIT